MERYSLHTPHPEACPLVTLRAKPAAQCIVIGPVCLCVYVCVFNLFVGVFVCLWACYYDNSKLRASIFTKLDL